MYLVKKKKNIRQYIIRSFCLIFVLLLAGILIWCIAARSIGKKRLYQRGLERTEQLPVLTYQGKEYRYNEDIRTVLVMGIDTFEEVQKAADSISGGQSDAIFLLVWDQGADQFYVIGVNRDTITDIDVYTPDGYLMGTIPAQLTLQHGYGDGMELSCERSVKAVSNLFYQLPIHGYCALNMGAIAVVNDAVGGVTVTVQDRAYLSSEQRWMETGEQVTLAGEDAYWYLRWRDIEIFSSAGGRLERQKQYLSLLFQQAKRSFRRDIRIPFRVYREIRRYMVTDMSAAEFFYLATRTAKLDTDEIKFLSVPGTVTMGQEYEGKAYEEFYVDEDAFYEMVIGLFYKEIE